MIKFIDQNGQNIRNQQKSSQDFQNLKNMFENSRFMIKSLFWLLFTRKIGIICPPTTKCLFLYTPGCTDGCEEKNSPSLLEKLIA